LQELKGDGVTVSTWGVRRLNALDAESESSTAEAEERSDLLETRVRSQLSYIESLHQGLDQARKVREKALATLAALPGKAEEKRRQRCECPLCGMAVDAFNTVPNGGVNLDPWSGSPRKRIEIEAAKQLDAGLSGRAGRQWSSLGLA
jgi:uncharacterized coiled-coil protein SlyX